MAEVKLQAAKQLIKEGRLKEARALLKTLDHPTARQWLAKIDALEQRQRPSLSIALLMVVVVTILAMVGGGVFLILSRTEAPQTAQLPAPTEGLSPLPTSQEGKGLADVPASPAATEIAKGVTFTLAPTLTPTFEPITQTVIAIGMTQTAMNASPTFTPSATRTPTNTLVPTRTHTPRPTNTPRPTRTPIGGVAVMKWRIIRETDRFTDTEVVIIMLEAEYAVRGYITDYRPILAVGCMNRVMLAYIGTEAVVDDDNIFDSGLDIQVRFDQNRATTARAMLSDDFKNIYFTNSTSFVGQLLNHNRLLVRYDQFGGDRAEAEFDIRGLGQAMRTAGGCF